MQGQIGDCWLLAGIAALAEFSTKVESLFHETELNTYGKYKIRIYDPCQKRWNWLTIDDYIPLVSTNGGEPKPLSCQPRDNELWVLLLEKACAKWFGGYSKLNGGVALSILMVLCECDVFRSFSQCTGVIGGFPSYDEQRWDAKLAHLVDARDRTSYRETFVMQVVSNQLFEELQRADEKNSIMVAWSVKDPPAVRGYGASGEPICSDGIVKNHAYSLVATHAHLADGRQWKVVQVRNPWGANPLAEWTGALCDNWAGWSQFPELKAKLGIRDWDWVDGMFFMTWEDFLRRFSHVGVAYVNCTYGLEKHGKQELRAAQTLMPWAASPAGANAPGATPSPALASAPRAPPSATPLAPSPAFANAPSTTPWAHSPGFASAPSITPWAGSPALSSPPNPPSGRLVSPGGNVEPEPELMTSKARRLAHGAMPAAPETVQLNSMSLPQTPYHPPPPPVKLGQEAIRCIATQLPKSQAISAKNVAALADAVRIRCEGRPSLLVRVARELLDDAAEPDQFEVP